MATLPQEPRFHSRDTLTTSDLPGILCIPTLQATINSFMFDEGVAHCRTDAQGSTTLEIIYIGICWNHVCRLMKTAAMPSLHGSRRQIVNLPLGSRSVESVLLAMSLPREALSLDADYLRSQIRSEAHRIQPDWKRWPFVDGQIAVSDKGWHASWSENGTIEIKIFSNTSGQMLCEYTLQQSPFHHFGRAVRSHDTKSISIQLRAHSDYLLFCGKCSYYIQELATDDVYDEEWVNPPAVLGLFEVKQNYTTGAPECVFVHHARLNCDVVQLSNIYDGRFIVGNCELGSTLGDLCLYGITSVDVPRLSRICSTSHAICHIGSAMLGLTSKHVVIGIETALYTLSIRDSDGGAIQPSKTLVNGGCYNFVVGRSLFIPAVESQKWLSAAD